MFLLYILSVSHGSAAAAAAAASVVMLKSRANRDFGLSRENGHTDV